MTRLDGEKKSPLPWIIGLIVLALLAAAIYYFTVAKGTDAVVANENGVELIDNAPGGLGVDNSANVADVNAVDANTTDANTADVNATDANATDANSAVIGGTDANAATSNMTDANAMDANSAMMSNSATADNTVILDSAAPAMPAPAMTPASANPKPTSNDVMATRSKTIKTDDKTVIYEKSVKADGTVMRDKKIVAEPVKGAKKEASKP